MEFTLWSDGYWPHYRSLRLVDGNRQKGWDVFALQTALLTEIAHDGTFGKQTEKAVREVQGELHLVVDGIAGTVTQTALTRMYVDDWTKKLSLKRRLMFGQLQFESSCLHGNQSPIRSNGTADCGVAQRNNEHTPTQEGFTVPDSIEKLAHNLDSFHRKYSALSSVPTERRAWELAAGSWNAPAWTNWLAGIRDSSAAQPGPLAIAHIENYIAEATALVVWTT